MDPANFDPSACLGLHSLGLDCLGLVAVAVLIACLLSWVERRLPALPEEQTLEGIAG